MHKNKKEDITPFGLVTDPFYTVYTEIHELMHGAQAKYFTSSDSDKTTLEHYELLYKGLSRDEAKRIQKAKNPNSSKDSHYERCFIEKSICTREEQIKSRWLFSALFEFVPKFQNHRRLPRA